MVYCVPLYPFYGRFRNNNRTGKRKWFKYWEDITEFYDCYTIFKSNQHFSSWFTKITFVLCTYLQLHIILNEWCVLSPNAGKYKILERKCKIAKRLVFCWYMTKRSRYIITSSVITQTVWQFADLIPVFGIFDVQLELEIFRYLNTLGILER